MTLATAAAKENSRIVVQKLLPIRSIRKFLECLLLLWSALGFCLIFTVHQKMLEAHCLLTEFGLKSMVIGMILLLLKTQILKDDY